ncbi:DNA-directed RNA polymerase mitochondrial precursor [Massariosphaeria phaeospora]|uniref:DNA-directed RNA polymerase n=1 Tax=Massariosphaeria phaeospora TaxID=100035 RepID=A0A7C8M885_9PLEO|nr:DNA-directed RNA polymerase mitochondrial precursor [Massariosphaeria phaeospora]
MLARAARRNLRRDAFRASTQQAEQLTLPWLCPAQMRWAASIGTLTAQSAALESRKQPLSSSRASRQETRCLATAADMQPAHHNEAPFHSLLQPWGARTAPPSLSRLQPWDTSKPLVIHDSLAASAAPVLRMAGGIGGDPIELHQNLYACLRVGRIDRATAIIQRLTAIYNPWAPEVIDAHNVFLQTMFDLAKQDPSPDSMSSIEDWYNKHMVRQAIEPNAQTIVTLLRAAMNFIEGGERDDAIRRYLTLAHEYGPDVADSVNSSPEFSDEEFDTLIKFQPDKYEEPPSVEELQESHISTPAGRATLIEHGLISDPGLAIKPQPQKGLGLKTLRQALGVFDDVAADEIYPHDMKGTQADKDEAYARMRQLRLEKDSTEAAVERWKIDDAKLQAMGVHGVLNTKPVQALMWQWYSALLPLLTKEMQRVKQVLSAPVSDNLRNDRHIYGTYLEKCAPEKLAAITVSRAINAVVQGQREDTGALKIGHLSQSIGRAVETEANSDAKQKHSAVRRKQRRLARLELLEKLSRVKSEHSTAPKASPGADSLLDTFMKTDFPAHVRTKIGALALENLLQAAKITVTANDPRTGEQLTSTQTAFHHHTGFLQGKKVGYLAPHGEILRKLRTESVHELHTVKLPMVCEPKPWASFDEGGYYTRRDNVVRQKSGDSAQRAYAHSAIENGDMSQVLAGLDVLGKLPWKINEPVFRVMAEAWNAGESVGDLIPEQDDLQRPPEPAADASFDERLKWSNKLKEYENLKGGLHSQRCFQNFQLEVARAFAKEEKIYFPHSVDFRGRAYPVPPVLNHMGADVARGLLKFANGKELGSVGLQWLRIHLANLYGFDKASLRDREQFSVDNVQEIFDSATNPLGGRRWWAKAEDPWQCLACCMELKNALDSPDPTRFVSRMPVHQDGTCNGLQHYAALGGDEAGASQVNLEPSDRPQDIYTGVAELVKGMVTEDAAQGNMVAKYVEGKVTRRVVKRTVMTNVYGVTFMGAKSQVHDELRELIPAFEPQPGVSSLSIVAMYVAKKIFAALGQIFNGAQEIQYWLSECGERITTSITTEQIRKIRARGEGADINYAAKYQQKKKLPTAAVKKIKEGTESFTSGIIWTTPLKMPVVQPYRKNGSQIVKTKLQDISVAKRSLSDMIDKRRQLQGFPPNFIHSLDATHMILSALKCDEMGVAFAAVHDSFWTHAADIPNLNIILRDAFVRMHSEDIIGRLAAEFEARYAGSMYRANIIANSHVARQIREWRRQADTKSRNTSKASADEVALEAKRQELLNSENPAEQLEGAQMVTPTSIWLATNDPRTLASYRLALLGEIKTKGVPQFDKVKEKVLGAEAEAVKDNTDPSAAAAAQIEPELDEAETEGAKLIIDRHHVVQVWLPLSFPPVPKKGSWDVRRLRESKYFFS